MWVCMYIRTYEYREWYASSSANAIENYCYVQVNEMFSRKESDSVNNMTYT